MLDQKKKTKTKHCQNISQDSKTMFKKSLWGTLHRLGIQKLLVAFYCKNGRNNKHKYTCD